MFCDARVTSHLLNEYDDDDLMIILASGLLYGATMYISR